MQCCLIIITNNLDNFKVRNTLKTTACAVNEMYIFITHIATGLNTKQIKVSKVQQQHFYTDKKCIIYSNQLTCFQYKF